MTAKFNIDQLSVGDRIVYRFDGQDLAAEIIDLEKKTDGPDVFDAYLISSVEEGRRRLSLHDDDDYAMVWGFIDDITEVHKQEAGDSNE